MTIFDRPIRQGTTEWLREMITMETEDYSDADPYTAHLLPPLPPSPSPLALSPTHAAVAAALSDRDDGPVEGVEAVRALSVLRERLEECYE